MSLERRNLQQLIRKFERSGDWPVDKHDKTLAQTILDAGWRKVDDELVERIYQAQGFNAQTGEGMRDAIRAVLTGETK